MKLNKTILLALSICIFYAQNGIAADPVMGKVSRASRWEGAFAGCKENATFEEKTKYQFLNLYCACLATYIDQKCNIRDNTKSSEVVACLEKVDSQKIINDTDKCYNQLQQN